MTKNQEICELLFAGLQEVSECVSCRHLGTCNMAKHYVNTIALTAGAVVHNCPIFWREERGLPIPVAKEKTCKTDIYIPA